MLLYPLHHCQCDELVLAIGHDPVSLGRHAASGGHTFNDRESPPDRQGQIVAELFLSQHARQTRVFEATSQLVEDEEQSMAGQSSTMNHHDLVPVGDASGDAAYVDARTRPPQHLSKSRPLPTAC
jgi:hypothetical protein